MIEESKLKRYFAFDDKSAKNIASKLNMLNKVKMHPRPQSGSTKLNMRAFIQFLYPGMMYYQEIEFISWKTLKGTLGQLPPIFVCRLNVLGSGYLTIKSALDRQKGSPYKPAYKIVEDNFKSAGVNDLFCSLDWRGWQDSFTNVYVDAYSGTSIHSWVKDVFESIVKLWIAAHIESVNTDPLRFAFDSIADGTVPLSVFDPPAQSKIKHHTIILTD
jgi:hypothetical protein